MNIQPSSDSGQSMPPLNNAQDLINAFYGLSNAGDQVELFFAVAESRPGEAFLWFVTILQNRAEPPLRALSLQGLGHITHEPTRLNITSGQSDYSVALLHLLAEEIRGSKAQSNDLTRWAAAWAIEALRFSRDLLAHVEGGALVEPPERIRREIVDRKLDEMERVERLNSRGSLTVDYERYLEFWLYAADATVEFLHDQTTNRRFLEVAGDLVNLLFVRGIELGVKSINSDIQKVALEFAKQRFTTNEAVEQRLYETLKRFLLEDYRGDLGFQRMAAEAVVRAGNWLDRGELTKAAILCERWERIVQIGEPAVPMLEKVVWKVLQFSTKPQIDLDRAVKTISEINFSSRDQKLRILSKILLYPDDQVRETVAKILRGYKIKSDEFPLQVSKIIEVITHIWNLDESKLNDSTLSELSQLLENLESTKSFLRNSENQAIYEVRNLSNEFKLSGASTEKYIAQKANSDFKLVDTLCNKIIDLLKSIQDFQKRIDANRRLLKNSIDRIVSRAKLSSKVPSSIVINFKAGIDNYDALIIRNPSVLTYNECTQISTQLQQLKDYVIRHMEEVFKKNERLSKSGNSGFLVGLLQCLLGLLIVVPIAVWISLVLELVSIFEEDFSFFIFISNKSNIITSLLAIVVPGIAVAAFFALHYSLDEHPFKYILNDLKKGWL